MNNEILKLAKRHQDALIGECNELIGFEFSIASLEAFYRAAYNAGLERAANKAWMHYMDVCMKHGHGPDVELIRDFCCAAAIRALKEGK